jgi:hypothetical protein
MLSLVLTALLNVLAYGKATPGAMAREQAMNAQDAKKPGFMMIFSLVLSALIGASLARASFGQVIHNFIEIG